MRSTLRIELFLKYRTKLEMFDGKKHTALFGLFLSDEEAK
jgi:hypothetical protein